MRSVIIKETAWPGRNSAAKIAHVDARRSNGLCRPPFATGSRQSPQMFSRSLTLARLLTCRHSLERLPSVSLALACLLLAGAQLAGPSPTFAKGGARQYVKQPAEWYATPEAKTIAANILSYQSALGGWPKNIDTTAA